MIGSLQGEIIDAGGCRKNLHAKANTVYNALGRSQSLNPGFPLPPINDCRTRTFSEAFPQHFNIRWKEQFRISFPSTEVANDGSHEVERLGFKLL